MGLWSAVVGGSWSRADSSTQKTHLFESLLVSVVDNAGRRVILEIDDTDLGQLRQVVQLVSDDGLLRRVTDVFGRMRHSCGSEK